MQESNPTEPAPKLTLYYHAPSMAYSLSGLQSINGKSAFRTCVWCLPEDNAMKPYLQWGADYTHMSMIAYARATITHSNGSGVTLVI